MTTFSLQLAILPPPQRRLWDELGNVPVEFVLYYDTMIALHIGHRNSEDFAFFGDRHFDPRELLELPFLTGARIIQVEPNTLTAIIDRGGAVEVSFFGLPEIPRLSPPRRAPDNHIQIASLLDLAGTKASDVQVRAEAKDYIDMDALITTAGIGLPAALTAARAIYGSQFNPQSTLKALSYFGDGNLPTLPEALKARLAQSAREVDLDRLPDLAALTVRAATRSGAP